MSTGVCLRRLHVSIWVAQDEHLKPPPYLPALGYEMVERDVYAFGQDSCSSKVPLVVLCCTTKGRTGGFRVREIKTRAHDSCCMNGGELRVCIGEALPPLKRRRSLCPESPQAT